MTISKNIPNELKKLDRWVCVKDGSKRPINAIDGSYASVSDKSTWCSYNEALMTLRAGKCSHLGFVFAGDGIVGIDIDHSAFDEYGFMTPEIEEAVNACDSYTEISKSGTGIHILVKGELPFNGKNNREGWEIYKTGRFFVMTGNLLQDGELREAQNAIDLILAEHFKRASKSGSSGEYDSRIWEPTWPEIEGTLIPVIADYPPVSSGSRHLSLVSYCGQMKSAGAGVELLRELAKDANQRFFNPPLSESEVDQVVASMARYER